MSTEKRLLQLAEKMNKNPEKINGLNRHYQFELKPQARYGVQFSDGTVQVDKEPPYSEEACILKMSESNLHKLLEGTWNPTVAYMTGQLKVDGEVRHALKLHEIVKHYTDSTK
ncbi:SCP2 sterol-binding domain-containing protein [Shouchella sp. 1P09AA]|uniref:SCP2 sterol-binding domain-containing protein n=1 Tax=unclassified Shouchella TaxID=2893065 RepID=UPI0039A25AA4